MRSVRRRPRRVGNQVHYRRSSSSLAEDTIMLTIRRTSTEVLKDVKSFFVVHYYPAQLAHAPWMMRRRHARVRSFLDPLKAASFTSSIWHSKQWRLLAGCEVRRTGTGFKSSLPF
jgi:hypothetical protein